MSTDGELRSDHERTRSYETGRQPFEETREIDWNEHDDASGALLRADDPARPWNAFAREHGLGDGRAIRLALGAAPSLRTPLELEKQAIPKGARL